MDGKEATVCYGQVSFTLDDEGQARFFISGELDHHSVREIREIIDERLVDYRPERVVLDLDKVTFTDSAGLGLVLGRYSRISAYGGSLTLINVPEDFMKILRLSGADRFLSVQIRAK